MDCPDVDGLPIIRGNKDGLLDMRKLAREKDTEWFVIQGYEELGEKSGAKLQTRLLEIPLRRSSAIHPLSCCPATNRDREELRHHSCDQCGKSFKRRSHLIRHYKSHTGGKPYCCDQCGKSFKTRSHLMRHYMLHTGGKPYCCDQCGKSFRAKSELKLHHMIHTGERPYCCDQCGKSFKTKAHLKRHRSVHTKEKPYCCDQCGKSFKINSHLTQHHIIHTGEKSYCCDQCGKSFKTKGDLKGHCSVHTKEKPYCCDQCGKSFKTNSDLTSHHIIHTGEKSYCCDQCGKSFKRMRELKHHKRSRQSCKVPTCLSRAVRVYVSCSRTLGYTAQEELELNREPSEPDEPSDQTAALPPGRKISCESMAKTEASLKEQGLEHEDLQREQSIDIDHWELRVDDSPRSEETSVMGDIEDFQYRDLTEEKDDDWMVMRAVMSDFTFEPTDGDPVLPQDVGNVENQDDAVVILPPCEAQDSTLKLAASSPSSDIEVFDSFDAFLKVKNINYAHCPIFSASEDDNDIQTRDRNPRPQMTPSCETEPEPDCEVPLKRNTVPITQHLHQNITL